MTPENGTTSQSSATNVSDQQAAELAILSLALNQSWQTYLDACKTVRKGASEKVVHDVRIATRRLLAAVDLVRTAFQVRHTSKARHALSEQLEDLGPLRDAQVHLQLLEPLLSSYPDLGPLHEALINEQQDLAKRAMKRAQKLDTKEVEHCIDDLQKAIRHALSRAKTPDWRDQMLETVDAAFSKTIACREVVNSSDTDTIHQTRLSFRSFRYMAEALRSLLGEMTDDRLEEFAAYQRQMGDVQDVETLIARVRHFASEQPGASAITESVDQLVVELESRKSKAAQGFLENADALFTFWGSQHEPAYPELDEPEGKQTMDVFVLRHAEAVNRGTPGYDGDSERPLTPDGEKEMKRAAKGMRTLKLSFDVVLSSPLIRAKQTADIVADVLNCQDAVEVTDALAPDGDPRLLLQELQEKHGTAKSILLVGHEPYLTSFISILVTGDLALSMGLKKGALCKVTLSSPAEGHSGTLKWVLNPKHLMELR